MRMACSRVALECDVLLFSRNEAALGFLHAPRRRLDAANEGWSSYRGSYWSCPHPYSSYRRSYVSYRPPYDSSYRRPG